MFEEPRHPVRPVRVGPDDWSRLARAVPAAFDVRKIVMAAVGVMLVQAGWSAIESISPPSPAALPRALGFASLYGVPFRSAADFAEALRRPAWNVTAPARVFSSPLTDVFAIDSLRDRAPAALLRLLWAIVVLGPAGAAIARLAVVEAATGRRPTLGEGLGTGLRAARGVILAPMLPLAAALLLGAASSGFGLVARMAPAASAFLFVGPLALGVATALLLSFMVASWPLIPVAAAAESEGAVEVVGRCFGYLRGRPMGFAACVLASWGLGTLGLATFEVFLSAAVHLAVWGMGLAAFPEPPGSMGGMVETPAALFVGLGCQAWAFAYFWCAAARAYLLLRQDVDDVPSRGSAALR